MIKCLFQRSRINGYNRSVSLSEGDLEAMDVEAIFCLEKLSQKKMNVSGSTKYIYQDMDELKSRHSALEQLLGELNYWLSTTVSNPQKFEINQNYLAVEKIDFWRTIQGVIDPAKIVVDLGCGVRPSMLWAPELRICVEMFEPYFEHLKSRFVGLPLIIVKEDVLDFLKKQPDKSIDTLVANDLIEHLEKPKGQDLIREIERTVINQALVFTPYGFMEQHVDEGDDGWGWMGNGRQTHLSGWLPEDFLGWKIIYSQNYHLDKGGYSDGAFAAIYKPDKPSAKKNINIILKDEILDAGKTIGKILEALDDRHDFNFKLYLPPSLSVGAFPIRAGHSKIDIPVAITSFNLEIRRPNSILVREGNSSEIGVFGLLEMLKVNSMKNMTLNLIISSDHDFAKKIEEGLRESKLESSLAKWLDSKNQDLLIDQALKIIEGFNLS